MELHNQQTGKIGEDIAAEYLLSNGFIIIARNWRFKHYEVDIIASKNNLLHFIEVKTRNTLQYGYPEESISKDKMQHLKNAAAAFQYQHPKWKYIQFDALAIQLKLGLAKEIFFIEDIYF
jgi:putative endonuclease